MSILGGVQLDKSSLGGVQHVRMTTMLILTEDSD